MTHYNNILSYVHVGVDKGCVHNRTLSNEDVISNLQWKKRDTK